MKDKVKGLLKAGKGLAGKGKGWYISGKRSSTSGIYPEGIYQVYRVVYIW